MSLASLIEAVTAAHRQPVGAVLLCPYNRKEYTPKISRMILEDIPWFEAREVLDVPDADSHRDLPPTIRVDTMNSYFFAVSNGSTWGITPMYPRHWGAR
jgi:hypothetical protein